MPRRSAMSPRTPTRSRSCARSESESDANRTRSGSRLPSVATTASRAAEVQMTHHEHEPLAGKRAAVMIGPLFEDLEAAYPYYRLQEAGATVELIGIEGGTALK